MGFALESGYTPLTIEAMMLDVMTEFNTQFGTSYDAETFAGTNAYKYFYALIQRLQANEVRTSEIFAYLQQYITVVNLRISRPAVTNPGIIEALNEAGYIASVKKPIDADAGKVYICVDKPQADFSNWEDSDDYADEKLEVCTLIMNSTVGGTVSQGTETEAIVLDNGQSFDFKFDLPNRIEPLLRLTTTLSENNQVFIETPEDQKATLMENIAARYGLGKNFEPQRYFSTVDAPWASSVILEYSLDAGSTWLDDIIDVEYDDLYVILLENISLVES